MIISPPPFYLLNFIAPINREDLVQSSAPKKKKKRKIAFWQVPYVSNHMESECNYRLNEAQLRLSVWRPQTPGESPPSQGPPWLDFAGLKGTGAVYLWSTKWRGTFGKVETGSKIKGLLPIISVVVWLDQPEKERYISGSCFRVGPQGLLSGTEAMEAPMRTGQRWAYCRISTGCYTA